MRKSFRVKAGGAIFTAIISAIGYGQDIMGITILPEIYSRISKSADIQYENLSSDEFEARIKSNNVVLVDVRTPSEFNQTHIPGAVNIDYYGSDFKAKISDLEKRPL